MRSKVRSKVRGKKMVRVFSLHGIFTTVPIICGHVGWQMRAPDGKVYLPKPSHFVFVLPLSKGSVDRESVVSWSVFWCVCMYSSFFDSLHQCQNSKRVKMKIKIGFFETNQRGANRFRVWRFSGIRVQKPHF